MTDLTLAPVREGDLIVGKYRVERVIGAGGMGVVVAARHEQLGQLVAIKFMRDEALGQGDAVERFLREARAAVKLKSEHVAKVLDVGKLESGAPYMIMEFLEGSDLGRILIDEGPMAVDRAVLLVMQACEAVAEAHSMGIVHRDLKPQNLFITRTVSGAPRLKVLDFGVSKALGMSGGDRALTRTRAMLGSPLYMPPEQMRSSRDVDTRVDIWALGVVLFELLTQRWPFEAESMPELCLKVVTEPPQSLAELRPDVPQSLVDVVERCLAKEPEGRFASAHDLAAALEPFAPPLLSRIPAERSRTSLSDVGMSQGSGMVPRPTLPSTDRSGAPSGPTPASWAGSAQRSAADSPAAPPRDHVRVVIAAVVALAIGGGVTATALLRHRTPNVDASSSAPPPPAIAAAFAPSPPGPPPAPKATDPVAANLAPAASAAPSIMAPAASSSPSSARPPTDAPVSKHDEAPTSAPAASKNGAHPSGAFAHPSPSARPSTRDDDIPALR